MAFKMKGFPQHATSSTFKQHATSSAFKQQQMTVPGADDLTDEQRKKFEKFQDENKLVYYNGKTIPISEMKRLEQERINRINAESGTEGEVLEDRTSDAMGIKNATKAVRDKYNIDAPKTGIGKIIKNIFFMKNFWIYFFRIIIKYRGINFLFSFNFYLSIFLI